MLMFKTEFDFTLPCGYLDDHGTLHREGLMRRATAADEILPLRDPRVADNQAYLAVILLSRVVTKLGAVPAINPKIIESLFATDMAFLQDLYNQVNQLEPHDDRVVCPECHHHFRREQRLGESSATPLVN
jgi:hypothetical protein